VRAKGGFLSSLRRRNAKRALNTAGLSVFLQSVKQLHTLNTKLLADLTEAIRDWKDETCLGALFVDFAPLFKLYAQYTSNHARAVDTLSSPQFRDFIEECQAHPRAVGRTVDSLLIEPVQRVPRYRLLLNELLKATSEEHADRPALAEAVGKVDEAAQHINHIIKTRQNRERVREVQHRLRGCPVNLLELDELLIREGELVKICRKEPRRYVFFLTSSFLIYGTRMLPTGVKHHRTLELNTVSVEEIPGGATHLVPAATAAAAAELAAAVAGSDVVSSSGPHLFSIASAKKSFIIAAPSPAEKIGWVTAIKTRVQELRNSGAADEDAAEEATEAGAAPVWASDQSASKCQLCGTSFNMVRRRHHCRKCGRLVCSSCSLGRMKLSHIDKSKPVRVCDRCLRPEDALPDPSPAELQQLLLRSSGGPAAAAAAASAAACAIPRNGSAGGAE